jgi:1-acyl-sn-glycerol-3-phosphate acyltransferase
MFGGFWLGLHLGLGPAALVSWFISQKPIFQMKQHIEKILVLKQYLEKFLSLVDIFGLFERDPFGNYLIIKRILMSLLGGITYNRLTQYNNIVIEGTEHLEDLPDHGVLFLSNHQTYFMDVITMFHIFFSTKWGFRNTLRFPIYLLAPRAKVYYVAASETMKDGGLIPKIFAQCGAITVERSWRAKGQNVNRDVDKSAGEKVGKGLDFGWVVSFPQGTTSPYAPIRKGTAHLIKTHQPIVIPVVVNGFRRAFDKKGLLFKKLNTTLTVTFKPPMEFDPDESLESITEKVRDAIEQRIPVEKLRWLHEKE